MLSAVLLSRRQSRLLPLLPAVWLWLAMAAALLMAIAPVVSYTLQALGAAQEAAVHQATSAPAGHTQPAAHHGDHTAHPVLPPPAAATHAVTHDTHDTHTGAHGHDVAADTATHTAPTAASNPHADHGAACDYCLIAARALAVIAALLWLLLAPHNAGLRPTGPATRAPARQPWPAHAARGPPLIA